MGIKRDVLLQSIVKHLTHYQHHRDDNVETLETIKDELNQLIVIEKSVCSGAELLGYGGRRVRLDVRV